jgi:hypothetical protein
MQKDETMACHQYYDFRITASELKDWHEMREKFADRSLPIEDRRRWFTVNSYTEPRLCRYRESMQWPGTASFPFNAGYVAVERLPIRHYPHRDPLQLERRCRIRAAMMAHPDNACINHWKLIDWRQHVVPNDSPELYFWKPGTELPEFHFRNHLALPPKRALQRFVHAHCLRFLDRFRPKYSDGTAPQPMPKELNEKLARELRQGTNPLPILGSDISRSKAAVTS